MMPRRFEVALGSWFYLILCVWCLGMLVLFLGDIIIPGRTVPATYPLCVLFKAVVEIALASCLVFAVKRSAYLPKKLVVPLLAASTLATATAAAVAVSWMSLTLQDPSAVWTSELWVRFGFNFQPTLWFFSFLTVAVRLRQDAIRSQAQIKGLAEVKRRAYQARLSALRYQINPHFLFNALNALSSLLLDGQRCEARLMMINMRRFLLDHILHTSDAVRLGEELDAIAAYLVIESVRFGDRLKVEIACEAEHREALVPSLLLQPLVENAVKHSLARSAATVTIGIRVQLCGEGLSLSVENDGYSEGSAAGFGVGHSNIRERLKLLYANSARLTCLISEGKYRAIITLPYNTQMIASAVHRVEYSIAA